MRAGELHHRAAGPGGEPGPPTAASNLGDAWADTVASLSGKTLFVLRNSLDAPLLARVFELCLARGRDSRSLQLEIFRAR